MTIASARFARLTETAPKRQDAVATPQDLATFFSGLATAFERFTAGDQAAQVRALGVQPSMVRELYPYDAAAIMDVFLNRLLHKVKSSASSRRHLKRVIRVLSWQARGSRYYEPYLLDSRSRQRFDHQADKFAATLGLIDRTYRVNPDKSSSVQHVATVKSRDAALDIMALCYLPEQITNEQMNLIPRHITVRQCQDILRAIDRLCKPLL